MLPQRTRARRGLAWLSGWMGADLQLGGRRVQPSEGTPVVDDHAGADDLGAAVERARDDGHLQQRRHLVLVLDRRLRVHQAPLVRQGAVRADERVARDRLPEGLDAEDVGDDLLGLAVKLRVDHCHVVVARDAVTQR